MFEKNLKLAYLLDFYGEVLDEHTKGVMKAYYDDDLSLAEIAEGEGISRQGIRHIIKKGEEQLIFLENALGLAAYASLLEEAVEMLDSVKRDALDNRASSKEIAARISKIQDIIVNK